MAITEVKLEETHNKVDTSLDTIQQKAIEVFTKMKGVFDASKCDMGLDFEKRMQEITEQKVLQIQAAARNENEDELRKEIAVFPDLFLSGAVAFQVRYLNKQNQINKYGDIYFAGHLSAVGVGAPPNSSDNNWHRYMVPYGEEITELVSDGVGMWGIAKDRTKAYFSGHCKGDDGGKHFSLPVRFTFSSDIKKILVGRVTGTYENSSSDSKYAKHLSIIILKNGKVYAFGANEGYECGQGTNNSTYYDTPKIVSFTCTDEGTSFTEIAGEEFVAEDGAVGFNGHRGCVILIGKHKNQNKQVAYGWGCNKDKHMPTFVDSHSSEYISTDSNNLAYKKPVRIFPLRSTYFPYKVWIIFGQKSSSYSDLHFITFMNLGSNENDQALYAAGYNADYQIDTSGNTKTTFIAAKNSDRLGGANMPKAIDIQGVPDKSFIVGIFVDSRSPKQENGKDVGEVYICGYVPQNVGMEPVQNNKTLWEKLTKLQSVSKMWYFGDTNNNSNPQSYMKPIVYLQSESTTIKLEVAGFEPAFGNQGEWIYNPNAGYSTVDAGYLTVDIRQGLAISSAATNAAFKGALLYGVTTDKRRIVVKGGMTDGSESSVLDFPHRAFSPIQGMPEIAM